MESTRHLDHFDGGARPVYVSNPEMHPEYEILKASGIYQLTNQPEGARTLTLLPIHQYGRCANPMLLTIVTFGIVPGILPGARAFEYDLDTDGVVVRCVHLLPIYDRISIWEWLVKHDDQRVLAEALAWSSLQQQSNQSLQRTNTRTDRSMTL
jgi:hypothetical protein